MLIEQQNVCSLNKFVIFGEDFDNKWSFEKSKVPAILQKFNMQGNDELDLIESVEICNDGSLLVKLELNNSPIYLIRLTVSQGNWAFLH